MSNDEIMELFHQMNEDAKASIEEMTEQTTKGIDKFIRATSQDEQNDAISDTKKEIQALYKSLDDLKQYRLLHYTQLSEAEQRLMDREINYREKAAKNEEKRLIKQTKLAQRNLNKKFKDIVAETKNEYDIATKQQEWMDRLNQAIQNNDKDAFIKVQDEKEKFLQGKSQKLMELQDLIANHGHEVSQDMLDSWKDMAKHLEEDSSDLVVDINSHFDEVSRHFADVMHQMENQSANSVKLISSYFERVRSTLADLNLSEISGSVTQDEESFAKTIRKMRREYGLTREEQEEMLKSAKELADSTNNNRDVTTIIQTQDKVMKAGITNKKTAEAYRDQITQIELATTIDLSENKELLEMANAMGDETGKSLKNIGDTVEALKAAGKLNNITVKQVSDGMAFASTGFSKLANGDIDKYNQMMSELGASMAALSDQKVNGNAISKVLGEIAKGDVSVFSKFGISGGAEIKQLLDQGKAAEASQLLVKRMSENKELLNLRQDFLDQYGLEQKDLTALKKLNDNEFNATLQGNMQTLEGKEGAVEKFNQENNAEGLFTRLINSIKDSSPMLAVREFFDDVTLGDIYKVILIIEGTLALMLKENAVQSLQNNVSSMQSMFGNLWNRLTSFGNSLVSGFASFFPGLSQNISTGFQTLSGNFGTMFTVFRTSMSGFVNALASNGFTGAFAFLRGAFTDLTASTSTFMTAFRSATGILKTAFRAAGKFLLPLYAAFEFITGFFSGFKGDSIVDKITSGIAHGIGNLIEGLTFGLLDGKFIAEGLKSLFDNPFTRALKNTIEGITNILKSGFNFISAVFHAVVDPIIAIAKGIWNVVSSVFDTISSVGGTLFSLLNPISWFFGGEGQGIFKTIANGIQWLADGITSMTAGIVNAITSIFNFIAHPIDTISSWLSEADFNELKEAFKPIMNVFEDLKKTFNEAFQPFRDAFDEIASIFTDESPGESLNIISTLLKGIATVLTPFVKIAAGVLKVVLTPVTWVASAIKGIGKVVKEIAHFVAHPVDATFGEDSFVSNTIEVVSHPLDSAYNFIFGDEEDKKSASMTTNLPQYAEGLSYVPSDNYTASLHEGEAILTAEQASSLRSAVASDGGIEIGEGGLGNAAENALKWGAVGAMFGGPIGAAVGALAGGIANFVGGDTIPKGLFSIFGDDKKEEATPESSLSFEENKETTLSDISKILLEIKDVLLGENFNIVSQDNFEAIRNSLIGAGVGFLAGGLSGALIGGLAGYNLTDKKEDNLVLATTLPESNQTPINPQIAHEQGYGKIEGSFDKGGTVPKDMTANVHKGEVVIPADLVERGGPMAKIALMTSQRLKDKYNMNVPPSLLFAQMIHETGGYANYLKDEEKYVIPKIGQDDHNYGGLTWFESAGEQFKGVSRPKGEGGDYVKLDSDEQYAAYWADYYLKGYDINGVTNPTDYAAAMKAGGYFTGDLETYTNNMNSIYSEHLDSLNALDSMAGDPSLIGQLKAFDFSGAAANVGNKIMNSSPVQALTGGIGSLISSIGSLFMPSVASAATPMSAGAYGSAGISGLSSSVGGSSSGGGGMDAAVAGNTAITNKILGNYARGFGRYASNSMKVESKQPGQIVQGFGNIMQGSTKAIVGAIGNAGGIGIQGGQFGGNPSLGKQGGKSNIQLRLPQKQGSTAGVGDHSGNVLKMDAQTADECTRQAYAAIYNAYKGTNIDASAGYDWYSKLKSELQAQELGFSPEQRTEFETAIANHFAQNPEAPIYLYQTGGQGHGSHALNRGSGNHATIIGRRLANGKYQVFDSNGGITHELDLSEIFDPTASGSSKNGTKRSEGNLLFIPQVAPTQKITGWESANGANAGQTSGTEARSAALGEWNVPYDNALYYLHEGELVAPPELAEQIRNMLGNPDGDALKEFTSSNESISDINKQIQYVLENFSTPVEELGDIKDNLKTTFDSNEDTLQEFVSSNESMNDINKQIQYVLENFSTPFGELGNLTDNLNTTFDPMESILNPTGIMGPMFKKENQSNNIFSNLFTKDNPISQAIDGIGNFLGGIFGFRKKTEDKIQKAKDEAAKASQEITDMIEDGTFKGFSQNDVDYLKNQGYDDIAVKKMLLESDRYKDKMQKTQSDLQKTSAEEQKKVIEGIKNASSEQEKQIQGVKPISDSKKAGQEIPVATEIANAKAKTEALPAKEVPSTSQTTQDVSNVSPPAPAVQQVQAQTELSSGASVVDAIKWAVSRIEAKTDQVINAINGQGGQKGMQPGTVNNNTINYQNPLQSVLDIAFRF